MKFTHKISKGTRFNQIYIPKEMGHIFEAGDLVEIKLLKKKTQLNYSKSLKKLTEFKELIIKNIFSFLEEFKEIEQIFIIGSFLTKEIDYNDIDIIIISKKDIEQKIYDFLIKKFNLKFHVIAFNKNKLKNSLAICPLVRSMFYYHISNKKILEIPKPMIDPNHIKFLLMFPEDSLKVNLESKSYYNALRRLIAIKHFLNKKEIIPDKIDLIIKDLIGKQKLSILKENVLLENNLLTEIKNIIRSELDMTYSLNKKWEKRRIKRS